MQAYEDSHPEEKHEILTESGESVLPADVKRSLVFLLFSVASRFGRKKVILCGVGSMFVALAGGFA